ncbi:MAG: PepSY domain-containing protein [Nitrosopumilus sp.]
MKPKIYKIGIPVGIAVLAIAVVASIGSHPMAQAQPGFFGPSGMGFGEFHGGGPPGFPGKMMMGHDIPDIEGTLPVGESIRENISSVKIDALEAGAIAAESIEEGKVLRGGIVPTQGYLTYQYSVVSSTDEQLYRVIVDAGNGEILHTSEGISIEELDARIAEMNERFDKEGFQYGKHHPMMGQ